MEKKFKVKKVTIWQIVSAVLAIALVVLAYADFKPTGNVVLDDIEVSQVSKEKAGQIALDYINNQLVAAGTSAELNGVEDSGSFYKLDITYRGSKINSYMTKDGKLFFPQGLEIDETKKVETTPVPQVTSTPTPVEKSGKPVVEAFVMSHCPFGTQIEKGLVPVMELLGDKADISIKFTDYAMHGQKELNEEMNQYCIDKEMPDKYLPYLKCFLEDGNSERCIGVAGIDKEKLTECVAKTDAEYKITEKFNDQATWLNGRYPIFPIFQAENDKYGVQGSPTLVINGKQVSSGRDSQSLLKAVCNAFETQPEECSKTLSSASPSAGFGYNAGATTDASCG